MDQDSAERSGRAAEDFAADFVRAHGIEVVMRNFRCRAGELDLVCRSGDLLIIVEVRQRATRRFGGAAASVTAAKQQRIRRATQFLVLRERHWARLRLRFDVIALDGARGEVPRIEWIRDAFRPAT